MEGIAIGTLEIETIVSLMDRKSRLTSYALAVTLSLSQAENSRAKEVQIFRFLVTIGLTDLLLQRAR